MVYRGGYTLLWSIVVVSFIFRCGHNTLVSIGSVLFQVRLLDSNVLCDQRGVTIAAWWISGHDKFLFM